MVKVASQERKQNNKLQNRKRNKNGDIVISCHNREETKDAIETLLDGSQRTPLENVFGKGPMLLSDIPEDCCRSKCKITIGIDEAGRGPVLGPMVYSAAYWSSAVTESDDIMEDSSKNANTSKVLKTKFRDSKILTDATRSTLYQSIFDTNDIGFAIRILHASEISRNMLRWKSPYNLNQMSHDAVIQMVDGIVDQFVKFNENKKDGQMDVAEIDTVYVDTVGNPKQYQHKLEKAFMDSKLPIRRFVVEKKADAKYATCSAASVLAKVTRDRIVENWIYSETSSSVTNQNHNNEFGSGYPSDPKCKKWMEENLKDSVFGYPDVVRFSWGPAKLALKEKAALVTWGDDDYDENDDETQYQPSMKSFFGDTANKAKKRKRFDYMQKMGLSVVSSIVER